MKLNRTGSNWNELERNKINENWDIIEGGYNDVVGKITDEVVGHLIDSAKLIWKEPVDTYGDLPTNAEVGETRMVRESDDGVSHVYRYDGEKWEKIQEIDVTLVNEVDMRLNAKLAETEKDCFYNSLINHKKSKGCITLIDDDGQVGFYTKLKKFVEEYKIPFTSAIITSRNFGGRNMTLEQIKEMQELGCEFVSHSHTHDTNKRLISMTEDELHIEFSTTKRIMRDLGLNDKFVVYPFGSHNELVRDVARQYFVAGIDTWWDSSLSPEGQIVKNPFNQYAIQRVNVQIGEEIAYKYMDEAAEKQTWFVGVMHVDQQGWYTDQYMRNLIEYALSKDLEFITVEEGVRRFGNLAQFDNKIIDNSGQIHVMSLKKYDNNAPITAFPKNQVTQIKVRNIDREDYNLLDDEYTVGGTIETFRFDEDIYSYQKFVSYDNRSIRYRSWDVNNNKWGKWRSANTLDYAESNQFTNNAPITAFPKNKVMKLFVRDVDVRDYDLRGLGGALETHRFDDDIYSYQKFVSRSNGGALYRSWDVNNNKWNEWRPEGDMSIAKKTTQYAINAPITDFPVDQVTIIRVKNVDAKSYGLPTGGVIKVYRFNEEYYSYQEYVSARTNTVLRRFWDNGNWSDWQ